MFQHVCLWFSNQNIHFNSLMLWILKNIAFTICLWKGTLEQAFQGNYFKSGNILKGQFNSLCNLIDIPTLKFKLKQCRNNGAFWPSFSLMCVTSELQHPPGLQCMERESSLKALLEEWGMRNGSEPKIHMELLQPEHFKGHSGKFAAPTPVCS